MADLLQNKAQDVGWRSADDQTVAGLACGILGAFAAAHALTKLLFGVTPADPVTVGLVSISLGSIALVASYLPARRAAMVDPTNALRSE